MDFRLFLSLLSTTAIVTGAVFAAVQLNQFKRQRARDSALQLLHSFRTPEFLSAVNIVFDLPEGLSRAEIEAHLGDKLPSIFVLFGTFESLGVLIFRREIEIQLVEDFVSGIIILSGKKLKRYLEEMRASSGRDTYYEWFQWLFEQMEKRESKIPPIPAYIAHRDWKA